MRTDNDPSVSNPNQGVNLYLNQVSQAGKAQEVRRTAPDDPEKGGNIPQDKVTLSKKAQDIGRVQSAAKEAPGVRQEKIDELKASIENGTYNVTGKQVAEKMISSLDMIT